MGVACFMFLAFECWVLTMKRLQASEDVSICACMCLPREGPRVGIPVRRSEELHESCWGSQSAAPIAYGSQVLSAHSMVPPDVASVLSIILLGKYGAAVLVERPSRSAGSGSVVSSVRLAPPWRSGGRTPCCRYDEGPASPPRPMPSY